MTASTRKLRTVTVNIPLSIGAAMRCVTSNPVARLSIVEINPALIDMAVIATGHTRIDVVNSTDS
jgi:spermidine synthase